MADLKTIAASHNIFFHSKMNHFTLQTVVQDHICQNCPSYFSVFEYIDSQEIECQRKLAHKEAKQKSRGRNIMKHKNDNRAAVKRYQKKHHETHMKKNLAAVQKFKLNNPDKHRTQNQAAVKKFVLDNPDKHSKQNVAAVQKYALQNLDKYHKQNYEAVKKHRNKTQFPPDSPSIKLQHRIISDFCTEILPNKFLEAGCATCGRLTPQSELMYLSDIDLAPLIQDGVTQIERYSSEDPISSLDEPVLINDLDSIRKTCHRSLSLGKCPKYSLANGLWLGKVPKELSDLSYTEQLLIARVRHNRCIVRVSSGMHKMRANAITFANPTPKIYNILPPPIDELDEVLAFIYTGPCRPTKSDFERTPLLVRRNKVATALNWLKLNHCDYLDLEISNRNLAQYPENDIPVVVEYRESFSNKNPESTAVHDMEEEEGTETGMCPFVVQGLTGEEYTTKSLKAIKAIALKHLKDNKHILAIRHSKEP
jgi:hypothetical protein